MRCATALPMAPGAMMVKIGAIAVSSFAAASMSTLQGRVRQQLRTVLPQIASVALRQRCVVALQAMPQRRVEAFYIEVVLDGEILAAHALLPERRVALGWRAASAAVVRHDRRKRQRRRAQDRGHDRRVAPC